jgi:enoyl-CoA hydratase/carnithine racemase
VTSIQSEQVDNVRLVRMSSTDGLNPLSAADRREFAEHLHRADQDPQVRAIVLLGSDRAFSVGADIKDFPEPPCDPSDYLIDALEVFSLPERIAKPVVAVVTGLAIAGGMELALASDWVFAEPGARMSLTEAHFGMLPGYALSRLPGIIGRTAARRLMMTCEELRAEDAMRLGLPVSLSERGRGLADALSFCAQTARSSMTSIAEIKRRTAFVGADADFRETVTAYARLWNLDDAIEGLTAFRERRQPDFSQLRG